MQTKKTKIICTVSDIRCDVRFIQKLYESGMNVVRINSAHASVEGAQKIVDNVRKVSDKIALMIDTKGPEVRLTPTDPEDGFEVRAGDWIEVHNGPDKAGDKQVLYTTYSGFVNDVPVGSHVLIDDGAIDLFVTGKDDGKLLCEVQNDGTIKGKKSVNVPGVHISLPALSDKDRKFVNWAIDADIDFIAHSFVRSPDDLKEIQQILDGRKSHIKYCVMVSRGDLGVYIPAERIHLIQQQMIHTFRLRKKQVIIATQMLHSMIENPRPTRAEVTDVANAIFQSTDAIMLSGETANGKYPVEAVQTMNRIALEAEKSSNISLELNLDRALKPIAAVLAKSLVESTEYLPVKAIILDTWTGRTGRYLAEFRPKVPIYAMCYNDYTMRELALTYDIYSYKFAVQGSKEAFVKASIDLLLEDGKISRGDLVAFIGGSFKEEVGATYMEFKYV